MHLLPFQLIPIILIVLALGVGQGNIGVEGSRGTFMLTVAAGLALYAFIMTILSRTITHPQLLKISSDGAVLWTHGFTRKEGRLPDGAEVVYDDKKVVMSPTPLGFLGFRPEDGVTTIDLPRGLKRVGSGSFVIRA